MTTRRSFLSSILIAGCAPAIVKAENIGKIFVPKAEIIVDTYGFDWLLPRIKRARDEVLKTRYGEVSETFFPVTTILNDLDVCSMYVGSRIREKDDPLSTPFYFDFDGVNYYGPTQHLTT